MEQAAWMAVAPHLSPEESTVGTRMDAKHLSPTPVGMDVTCRAELTQVEGRRLVFRVTAWDAQGPIGEGTHERATIQAPRFLEKAQKKLQENQYSYRKPHRTGRANHRMLWLARPVWWFSSVF